ncbi:MAG: hypothetical protein ACRDGV_04945 [Candidatus Limnocylindria bacterium]
MTTQSLPRVGRRWQLALLVLALLSLIGFGAVRANVLGFGDRFDRLTARVEAFIDPPPDRPTLPTVVVTPRPSPSPILALKAEPAPGSAGSESYAGPGELPSRAPAPLPTPEPVRAPVNVEIVNDHEAVFASQITTDDCAVAATQMVLTILGLGDTSDEFQAEIKGRIGEWQALDDSQNGGWGPAAVGLALAAYGATDYEVRAYATYTDALRDSAIAISELDKPVVMFPWWGAHTWVMTGYRADADPTIFPDAAISGAYILDPWYPRVSSIWGPSDEPGNFEDLAELERNWPVGTPMGIGPGWSRPEGAYEERDGRYVVLIPTTPRDG